MQIIKAIEPGIFHLKLQYVILTVSSQNGSRNIGKSFSRPLLLRLDASVGCQIEDMQQKQTQLTMMSFTVYVDEFIRVLICPWWWRFLDGCQGFVVQLNLQFLMQFVCWFLLLEKRCFLQTGNTGCQNTTGKLAVARITQTKIDISKKNNWL